MSQNLQLLLLSFAVFRIYLEVINFKFETLPLTSKMPNHVANRVHKLGFYFSLGYFVLFAPEYLMA